MKHIRHFIFTFLFFFGAFAPLSAQSYPGYERIPFTVEDDYILLPVNFSTTSLFNLVFFSVGSDAYLTPKGIGKMSALLNQDVYAWHKEDMLKNNPEMTQTELDERLRRIHEGSSSLFLLKKLRAWNFWLYDVPFFDDQGSFLHGDGGISLKNFLDTKSVKNIVVNFKEKILEINAPVHGKNGTMMLKLDTKETDAYYVLAELDGVPQPFLINFCSNKMVSRKDTKSTKVYEGKELESVLNNYAADATNPSVSESAHLSELRVGNISQKLVFLSYNDESLKISNGKLAALASTYNTLGLPFFEGKCVQLDFEHMMMYVW